MSSTSPNILFVLSDQERQRDWLPQGVEFPNRQRLIDQGMEFTNYFTHSSPCSPSRASIVTGQYVPQHGVNENVIFDYHRPLDPAIPTYGSALRRQGYHSAYVGKWHLGYGPHPDLDAHGFSDWSGNDLHFMGWAGTGAEFDPVIARQAAGWLGENAGRRQPWCLTVGLVNPHDVMWFPIDQADWQAAHPDQVELPKAILGYAAWKDGDPIPAYDRDYVSTTSSRPTSPTTCSPSRPSSASGCTSSTRCTATSTRPTRRRGCATSTTTSTSIAVATRTWA